MVIPHLSLALQQKVEVAQETGAPTLLTSLPIKTKGFSLNEQEFTNASALRLG